MRDHLGNFALASNMHFARGVLLLDDCEGGMWWTPSGTGGDDVHELSTDAAFTGTKSLKTATRTTLAAANDNILLTRSMPRSESGLVAMRCMAMMVDVSATYSIELNLSDDNGTDMINGALQWLPNTPQLQYLDAAGADQVIPGGALSVADGQWVNIELIIDCKDQQFLTARLDGAVFDLRGLGLYHAPTGHLSTLYLALNQSSAAAAPSTVYYDNIAVTEYLDL